LTEENIPPLTLLGLEGYFDPLRPETKSAVEKCRQAGIEVAMLTDDHPPTALAIALKWASPLPSKRW
jgi:P-type Ca2+ transporter type 2C